MDELRVFANEKGLDAKNIEMESNNNEGMILFIGPNRESKCTVYFKDGQVTGKKYIQFL